MDDGPVYCDRCGLPLTPAEGEHGHESCRAARALEPPRYCPRCGRRMVVKVTPHSWSSQCPHHGLTTSTP
jgi:primosomal protein N'